MIKMNKIFERQVDLNKYLKFLHNLDNHFLNISIEKISKRKINKLIADYDEECTLSFRFELLRNWISLNEMYTKDYVNSLDEIIKKLSLKNLLTSLENEYINHYNGVVFAKIRNLKQLIIDFPLNSKKEIVYYKYENSSLIDNSNNDSIITSDAECFLSNERIIFLKDFNVYSIFYNQIVDYKITNFGVLINLNEKKYLLRSEDWYILYVSIERLFKFLGMKI